MPFVIQMSSPQIANSTLASTEQTRLGKRSQTPHCVGGLRASTEHAARNTHHAPRTTFHVTCALN